MKAIEGPKFDKLSNLAAALQRVEGTYLDSMTIGSAESVAFAQARNSVVGVARSYRRSRLEFGRMLRQYKLHFKRERGWVAAAEVIADAVGCDARTIYRIIEGYVSASGLSPLLLEAMEKQAADPTAVRNREMVDELLQATPPRSQEEAAGAVAEARRKQAAKKTAPAKPAEPNLEQFVARIVKMIQTRYRKETPQQRSLESREIVEQVANALGIDLRDLDRHERPAIVGQPAMREAA